MKLRMLLWIIFTTCFGYYQSDTITIKTTRNYLFSFSIGKEGKFDITTMTPEFNDRITLAVCQRGRDYTAPPTASDREKCERLEKICETYVFNDSSYHYLNASVYDFALLACNTTFPFKFQYTIHIKNGKSELPISQVYSPEVYLILMGVYSFIMISYIIYCIFNKRHIKQIHRMVLVIQIVFVLHCLFESSYYRDYSKSGQPSLFLFYVSSLFRSMSDYLPIVLCSILTLGYSIVYSHFFRQQTQPFVIILLVYLFISFGSHIFKDIRLMVSLVGIFFILPITGRFVALNRHFITMQILSEEVPVEFIEVLKKKIQILQFCYFLVFVRLVICTLYDFTQEVSFSNSPYISVFVFEILLLMSSLFMIVILLPRDGVFTHIHLNQFLEVYHQPPQRHYQIMKDVKEKIDREEIVFFTYATSVSLSSQETAPIGIGYVVTN
ncbi:hypothetical protein ENUP19_0241G0033 [Entamoeba nuttalli]|uniref:Intimal thickness related receptor IRP domain-containing protein n=2 Tax=Entamoeba nuttalli TaxID=412467 RepID=K2GWL4_ENTNP|nr:hypothetical protein ENU1_175110 [Entamoeba nuttalli P19]EKE38137.1 hypothetical protein ENU1_175110 [Entamoeba nuttalli P19]|eukprot:XP_008859529.1 hypothetical protein ENU1_175110 [Entamoeba nuttalli P19]